MNKTFSHLLSIAFLLTGGDLLQAQEFEHLYTKDSISFRGLDTHQEHTVWISGNRGTVGRSVDGGATWTWVNPEGYEKFDFRDIEAFGKNEAIILSAGTPAVILRTTNGGKSWKEVYRNDAQEIFFDGMDFQGKTGFAFGDPIDGQFQLLKSSNKGKRWKDVTNEMILFADEGEAGFAASGTSIQVLNDNVWIGTGGKYASLFQRHEKKLVMNKVDVPINSGGESKGIFSISFADDMNGIVVGGDYMQDKDNSNNVLLTRDGGNTWVRPAVPVSGFKSCVIHLDDQILVATGTSGTDISLDGGQHWKNITTESFNVVSSSQNGNHIYFAGSKGNIAKVSKEKIIQSGK